MFIAVLLAAWIAPALAADDPTTAPVQPTSTTESAPAASSPADSATPPATASAESVPPAAPNTDPDTIGRAVDEEIGFQPAATDHAETIHGFHNLLLVIITGVAAFVTVLLLWVMVRYNARVNPKPSTFSHNTLIEVIWTIVPVVILVVIFIPSMNVLYEGDVVPKADLTIKAIGHQWNWSYEYPDNGNFSFLSEMLSDDKAKAAGEPRLLGATTHVVVPVGKVVRVIVTSQDVIHSWAVPAFGVKMDAVPGRLNETWFKANREGIFYGQCSELCGVNHAFMPIEVEVVSQDRFEQWLAETKTKPDTYQYSETEVAPAASVASAQH
ncbi:MAG: cytochrome c oxidase subunit II [Alphaproteobacteria bacterium]|nr:cytochrome c oxidase subunit II [Alphaproteobacteria bacterium]